jgi:hypothetical protein
MNKRWKIMAVSALIMLIVMAPAVTAQATLPGTPTTLVGSGDQATDGKSNTNRATQGLFFEDRDNYLDTTGISSLDKNLIFVNVFNLGYFGGDTTGGGTLPNAYTVTPYFDAGAGFFLGTNWIGAAFAYGVDETISLADSATKAVTLFSDGTTDTVTETENATTYTTYQIYDWFRLNAVFGNKIWGVRNDFSLTNRQAEGYIRPTITGGNTLGTVNINVGNTIAGVIPNPPAGGNTITTTPGGVVTNELKKGEILDRTISDIASFGIHLDQVIPAIAAFAPWAKAALGYTYTDSTTRLNPASGAEVSINTLKGFGWDYSVRDSLGTNVAYSFAHDLTAAEGVLGIGIGGGADFTLNELFTLSPELAYAIDISLYANKYTDPSGNETNIAGIGDSYYGRSYVNNGYYTAPNPEFSGTSYTEIVTRVADTYELSRVQQELNPAVTLNAEFGLLNFAVKYSPVLKFDWISQTYSSSTRTVTTNKYGSDSFASFQETVTTNSAARTAEKNSVTWNNVFAVGVQFWIKPEKLRFNLGAEFDTQIGTWTTTKYTSVDNKQNRTTKKTYDDGHEDASTIQIDEVLPAGGGTITENQSFTSRGEVNPVQYGFGPTFFFNDYINFDIYLENQSGRGSNWFELLMPVTWALQFNIRY